MSMPLRQIGLQASHLARRRSPILITSPPLFMATANADRRLALDAHARRRRIDVAALDGGDVAQAEELAAGLDADRADALLRGEFARDAQRTRSLAVSK
jgi:hypothetical protein